MTINTWLLSRQSLITATDSLFILKQFNKQLSSKLEGVNTWNRSLYQIYTEKTISADQYIKYQNAISTPIMQEGKDRESEIANLAKTDLGLRHIDANGDNVVTKEEYKIGATPDYYILDVDTETLKLTINEGNNESRIIEGDYDVSGLGTGILECKLTGEFTESKLLGYQFQVQHQLLCTGLKWAIIAIGIKDSRDINSPITKRHYYFIKANPKLHDAIILAAQDFWIWFDDVKNGYVAYPKPDMSNDKDKQLYRSIIGEETNDEEFIKLCEEYIETDNLYKEVKLRYDDIKSQIQNKTGYDESINLLVKSTDGSKYNITQYFSKESHYTEEDKAEAFKKAENIEIGSIKTKSKCSFKVSIV